MPTDPHAGATPSGTDQAQPLSRAAALSAKTIIPLNSSERLKGKSALGSLPWSQAATHRALRAAPVAEALAVARVDVDGLVAVARAPGKVVDVAHPLRLHLIRLPAQPCTPSGTEPLRYCKQAHACPEPCLRSTQHKPAARTKTLQNDPITLLPACACCALGNPISQCRGTSLMRGLLLGCSQGTLGGEAQQARGSAGPAARGTWKERSRLSQIQLRCSSSTTAAPGRRNCALARLLVCTLTNTPAAAMASSCALKGVEALNSTTRTCTAPTHGQAFSPISRHEMPVKKALHEHAFGWLLMLHGMRRGMRLQHGLGKALGRMEAEERNGKPARLPKLGQQREEALLVDDAPVGALALEGDHPRQRLPGRWRAQPCNIPLATVYA